MKIRNYLWIFNIIGAILIIISIMTPTSYNEETATLHFVWMTQIAVDVEPLAIYLQRTDLTLVIVSWILVLIIFTSSLIAIILNITYIKASRSLAKLINGGVKL